MAKRALWKTEIIIWTSHDPSLIALDDLARDAVRNDALCTKQKSTLVTDVNEDNDWDGNQDFFWNE